MPGGCRSYRGLVGAVAICVAMLTCAHAWGQAGGGYKGEPVPVPKKQKIVHIEPEATPLPGQVGPLNSVPITQRSSPLPPRQQPGVKHDTPTSADTVVDVRVVGNNHISLQRITPHVKTRAGRPFDAETVEEDVRRLIKSRMFVTVDTKYQRTAENGLVVIFEVVERPTLHYVKYVGSSVRRRHLDKQTNLKVGDSADPYMVTEAHRKLEEWYVGKGYGKVRITIMEGDKAGDRGAVFVINEGQKQRVWEVKFEGNTIASDSRLKTQIKSKVPLLYMVKGEVDRQKIDEDVDRLKSYYRGLGFFRARIGRELEFNERQNWVVLTFVIDEGPRYTVEDVSIVGNSKFENDELAKNLKLKSGQFFDQATMQGDLTALQDKYGGVGYIFSAVEPDLRFKDEPGKLDLVYHIQEGSRYRIGRIDVKIAGDNPRTRRHTVLNRISVRPGQIADIRELRSSERRLKGSGLFTNKPAEGIEPRLVWGRPGVDGEAAENVAGRPVVPSRGQSPDDVDPEDEWRPEPGCTDVPLTLVVHAEWLDEAQTAKKQPLIIRAQSPIDDFPRYAPQQVGVGASTNGQGGWQTGATAQPYGAQPNGAQPYGVQPYGGSPAAAPQTAAPQQAAPYGAGQVPLGRTQPDVTPSAVVPASGPGTGQVVPAQYVSPTPRPANQQYVPPMPTYGQPGYVAPSQAQPGVANPYAVQPAAAPSGPGYDSPDQLIPGSAPPGVASPAAAAQPGAIGQPVYGGPPSAAGPAFGSVAPEPFAFSDEEPTIEIPLNVEVQETQTGRLMLGVGVNSSSGLVGQVVVEEQNFDWRRFPTSWEDIRNGTAFRGGGQQFRIQAVPGTQVSQYSATFREPYFLDTLVSFSLSGQYFNRYFQNWNEQRMGGRIGFGYQFTPDLTGQVALRGENVLIYDPTVPTPPQLQAALGNNDLFTARFDLIHDTRDSSFLPTQGHYIDLGYEQAFGQFSYPRATIDARQHFLLRERPDRSGRHTLTLMNSTGFTGSSTPIFENFYAGGYQTLRGFYFRGASPLVNGVQVGGDFQFINTVEYMFPITADDMLRGVVFTDFGTVEPTITMTSQDFRVAPGAGLRISIPAMGPAPIALDFAFPVHYAPGDHLQTFSFFVGTQR